MPEHSCTCAACIRCCETNPGWMTPGEAQAAIAAGLAPKLMRDWLEPDGKVGNQERIYVLAPASFGHEGEDAPEYDFYSGLLGLWNKGGCVLLDKNRRCSIHTSGFKPIQCRLTLACGGTDANAPQKKSSNYAVARMWNTDEGRQALAAWTAALEKESSHA